jgi:SAM-dependent methyltransferase
MKVNYTHDESIHNKSAATEILPFIINLIRPKSIIDIGSGTGSWLSVAKELGVQTVLGIDGILVDEKLLVIDRHEFLQHDLTQPLKLQERYDMAICLEVAEHLIPESADIIVETLTDRSNIVLFSAAIPGQGGQFHLNEQWPGYWQKKFAQRGYAAFDILREKFWDSPQIEWWYKQNILIYAKTEGLPFFNYSPAEKVYGHIHPELFEIKTSEIRYLNQIIKDRIWEPKIKDAFKLFIKSIFIALK